MTIVEQHAIADEHFTADGHAAARIEETIWETLHMTRNLPLFRRERRFRRQELARARLTDEFSVV
jgi:hypothetical protein